MTRFAFAPLFALALAAGAAQALTGEQLEKALRDPSTATPGPTVVGMVKASEKPGHIAFALGDCETWVEFPVAAIAEAQQVGTMPCRDHSRPLVRITLASAQDETTRAIAALLGQTVAIGRMQAMCLFWPWCDDPPIMPRPPRRLLNPER